MIAFGVSATEAGAPEQALTLADADEQLTATIPPCPPSPPLPPIETEELTADPIEKLTAPPPLPPPPPTDWAKIAAELISCVETEPPLFTKTEPPLPPLPPLPP